MLTRVAQQHIHAVQRRWWVLQVLLVGLFLTRGIVLVCVIPPFEGWDEYQHLAYVVHLAETGERPVLGESTVSEALLKEVVGFPGPEFALEQLGATGLVGYETYWRLEARPSYSPPGPPVPLYEAQHDPLGYAWMVPLFRLAGGVEDVRSTVGVLRLANLLLASLALWIVLGCVGRVVPSRPDALGVGLLIATQPLLGVDMARVANDPLGFLLGTCVVALLLGAREQGFSRLLLRFAVIGFLAGLSVRAKALNLPLLPLLLASIAWRARPDDLGIRRALACGGLALATALAILLPELIATSQRFGVPTSIRDALVAHRPGAGEELVRAALSIDWFHVSQDLWSRRSLFVGGWSGLRAPGFLRDVHQWAIWISSLGLLLLLHPSRRRSVRITDGNVLSHSIMLCGLFHCALLAHVLLMSTAWGVTATNFWYAAATIPWWMLLVHQGGVAWFSGVARWTLPTLLLTVFMATNVAGIGFRMLPTYAQAPPGREALARLGELQPPFLGSATLLLAVVAWGVLALFLARTWWTAVKESRESP